MRDFDQTLIPLKCIVICNSVPFSVSTELLKKKSWKYSANPFHLLNIVKASGVKRESIIYYYLISRLLVFFLLSDAAKPTQQQQQQQRRFIVWGSALPRPFGCGTDKLKMNFRLSLNQPYIPISQNDSVYVCVSVSVCTQTQVVNSRSKTNNSFPRG